MGVVLQSSDSKIIEVVEDKFEPVLEEFSDSDEEREVYEKEEQEKMKRSVKPTPPDESTPPGIGICLQSVLKVFYLLGESN